MTGRGRGRNRGGINNSSVSEQMTLNDRFTQLRNAQRVTRRATTTAISRTKRFANLMERRTGKKFQNGDLSTNIRKARRNALERIKQANRRGRGRRGNRLSLTLRGGRRASRGGAMSGRGRTTKKSIRGGRRGGGRGGKKIPTAKELDKEIDNYMNENPEFVKENLDQELDSYMKERSSTSASTMEV